MRSSLRASTLVRNATPLWPDAIPESLHESSPVRENSYRTTTLGAQCQHPVVLISPSEKLPADPVSQDNDHAGSDHLILMLRQRVDQLEQELDSRNNPVEVDRIRREWHTSEELLQQSQRDNALKHETIEQYKIYVKEIEKLCSTMIGPDWKIEHDIRYPFGQSTGFSASTPLPKPSASSLRRSTSLISPSKRNSRTVNRHASTTSFSQFILNPVPSNSMMLSTIDDTPTGAMRKLMGSVARPTTQKPNDNEAISRASDPSILEPTIRAESNATSDPSARINTRTDDARLQQIQGLLVDLVGRKDGAKDIASVALCEQSRTFILESERRAEARELRLLKMLEEAQSC